MDMRPQSEEPPGPRIGPRLAPVVSLVAYASRRPARRPGRDLARRVLVTAALAAAIVGVLIGIASLVSIASRNAPVALPVVATLALLVAWDAAPRVRTLRRPSSPAKRRRA